MEQPLADGRPGGVAPDNNRDSNPAATLAQYRIAEELGLTFQIRIAAPATAPLCATCGRHAHKRYSLRSVPALPLAGCPGEPLCRARYVVELTGSHRASAAA